MSQQSRSTLKSYFLTGNVPTQDNFRDLIDSLIDQPDDQVFVDDQQNVGLGLPLPPARLAVETVSAAALPVTITLVANIATAAVTVTGTAALSTLVYPNDVIQVAGVTQLFVVASVSTTPTASLQLSPTPTFGAVAAAVSVLKNLLYVGGAGGTPALVLTNQGNLGLGTALPSQTLEVVGNVQATQFLGDGSQLTDLAPANLTGTIPPANLPPLSQIPGQIAASQLPSSPFIPFGLLTGQLAATQLPSTPFLPCSLLTGQLNTAQLPAGFSGGGGGAVSFAATPPVVPFGTSVSLSWNVPGAASLTLSLCQLLPAVQFSSAAAQITSPSGSYSFTPYFTCGCTLTAYGPTQQVISQTQLTVTVVPPVGAFVQACYAATGSTAASTVTQTVAAFGLQALTPSNVVLIASAMQPLYSAKTIIKAISSYYSSAGNPWALANTQWITAVLSSA